MRLAENFALAPAEVSASEREANWAVLVAAGLYLVGALLCASAVLLPHVHSPAGVAAVAVLAVITAAALLLAAGRGRGGLGLACMADLWGIALIAVLCASSGGSSSPFALIYLFAVAHAAAFQPRKRLYFVCFIGLLAFLAPLAYESHVSTMFGAVACVGVVLALLTCAAVHFALNRIREQRRRLQILIAASSGLDKSLDPATTLRTIARMAVPELAEVCMIDVFHESGSIDLSVVAASDPTLAAEIERVNAISVAHGQEEGQEHARQMRAAGYASAAAFPMVARGRTHGVISFWRPAQLGPYDRGLLAVLEDMAGRAAMAFDNARLYDERARVARTLRRSLMPSPLPTLSGLDLASYFRPSGAGSDIGGDFYDVFGNSESCWLVLGDVCGKGAEAAALTGFLRHTIAAYAREGSTPGQVLTQVNQAMLEQDFDARFATAIVVRVCARDSRSEVTLAVAGHPGALVMRADAREACELVGPGALLGILLDPLIEEVTTTLEPGDALVLYTDGLSEAHAPARVVTVARMLERLQSTTPVSPQGVIDALLGLIDLAENVRDDIAILCAQVSPVRGATGADGAQSTSFAG